MIFIFIIISTAMADKPIKREITYKKKTEIDFEALDIEGVLVKPQGILLSERNKTSFNPLIKLRTDFNLEMSQSVTAIQ